MKLCESCKWWVKLNAPCGDGECRKHAPEVRITTKPIWPVTKNASGCGDWEKKD